MSGRKSIQQKILPAGRLCQLLDCTGLSMPLAEVAAQVQVRALTELVSLSVTGTETHGVADIEPTTQPAIQWADTPNSLVSYKSPLGKVPDVKVFLSTDRDEYRSEEIKTFPVELPDVDHSCL
jgi:hypothetical protein